MPKKESRPRGRTYYVIKDVYSADFNSVKFNALDVVTDFLKEVCGADTYRGQLLNEISFHPGCPEGDVQWMVENVICKVDIYNETLTPHDRKNKVQALVNVYNNFGQVAEGKAGWRILEYYINQMYIKCERRI